MNLKATLKLFLPLFFPLLITAQDVNGNFESIPKQENATLRFQFGSCAANLGIFNRGKFKIFKTMKRQPADFMIWTGDNVYYLFPRMWKTGNAMRAENRRQRSIKPYMEFLKSRPQYAIYDDHDYGPNNSDGSFKLKDTALTVFKEFWKNPSYGLPDLPGCFFTTKHADAEFFFLDGRYYSEEGKKMFGEAQLEWLKEKLLASTARFKFIVSGSQIVSPAKRFENLSRCKDEYKNLMDFLNNNTISGVIFLTGDRHFAELSRLERPGNYPLYDITSSPLTSPIDPHPLGNKHRVRGSYRATHNFCRITLQGMGDDRVCLAELFNRRGQLLWSHEIRASELISKN